MVPSDEEPVVRAHSCPVEMVISENLIPSETVSLFEWAVEPDIATTQLCNPLAFGRQGIEVRNEETLVLKLLMASI